MGLLKCCEAHHVASGPGSAWYLGTIDLVGIPWAYDETFPNVILFCDILQGKAGERHRERPGETPPGALLSTAKRKFENAAGGVAAEIEAEKKLQSQLAKKLKLHKVRQLCVSAIS